MVASGIYGSVWNHSTNTALVLSSALLTTLLLGILVVPNNHSWRRRLCVGLAAAGGCALLDVACRWLLGPSSSRLGVGNGALEFFLGNASLHRHVGVWGDEGAPTIALLAFAVVLSIALAVRTSSRMLIFAAALTLLGTATNMVEVSLHGYDTDYLRFAATSGFHYNLGDVYEFEGALLMAWCALHIIATAHHKRGFSADR